MICFVYILSQPEAVYITPAGDMDTLYAQLENILIDAVRRENIRQVITERDPHQSALFAPDSLAISYFIFIF